MWLAATVWKSTQITECFHHLRKFYRAALFQAHQTEPQCWVQCFFTRPFCTTYIEKYIFSPCACQTVRHLFLDSVLMACAKILGITLYYFQRPGIQVSWSSQLLAKAVSLGRLSPPHNKENEASRVYVSCLEPLYCYVARPHGGILSTNKHNFLLHVSSWVETNLYHHISNIMGGNKS